MSERQLTKIQTKAMSIIVPRCGFNRNTHKSILYGPQLMGGANFRHLAVEQGLLQVQYFLRHWRSQSQVGRLLKNVMAWLQLSVGVSFPILEHPNILLPHMESKWIASMRSFLSRVHSMLHLDEPCIPVLQREHDIYLMDAVLGSNHFTSLEIRRINYCRLYLGAVTLSDLTKACGSELDPCKLAGNPSLVSSFSSHLSISQDRPSEDIWKLWKQVNLLWSDIYGKLRHPLGAWILSPQQQRQRHFAYVAHHRLWVLRQDGTYDAFHSEPPSRIYRATHRVRAFSFLPAIASPVHVKPCYPDEGTWKLVGEIAPTILPIPPQSQRPSTYPTFAAYTASLPPWEAELLQHISLDVDPFTFCVDTQPYLRAVSDGSSYDDVQGAFGWTIRNEQGVRAAFGMGPARGSAVFSYRAESCGLLSVLRFLIRIAEYTDMHFQWKGILATDAQSVLDTLSGEDGDPMESEEPINLDGADVVLDVLCPEWDVLKEIQAALRVLPGIRLQYVKGHQDRDIEYSQLDQLGQMNVDADEIAKTYQHLYGAIRPLVFMSDRTRAHLIGPTGTITAHPGRALRRLATTPPVLEYLTNKYNWSTSTADFINWAAHQGALKKQDKRRIHFTKLVFDILPTTSQANKFDKGHRTCPSCPHGHEDRDHILRCLSPSRQEWRDDFLSSISAFCTSSDTDCHLGNLLCTSFKLWFLSDHDITIDPLSYPLSFRRLVMQQNRIGWRQLFNGRFSNEWARIQNNHYSGARPPDPDSSSRRRTGDRWQVQLITLIWTKWDTAWSDRNQALHGYNAITRQTALRQEVRRQLTTIYDRRHLLEPRVETLLQETQDQHEAHTVSSIQNWLRTNMSIFRDSWKRAAQQATQGVRPLRWYFPPSGGG